jgi:hypothetical protein
MKKLFFLAPMLLVVLASCNQSYPGVVIDKKHDTARLVREAYPRVYNAEYWALVVKSTSQGRVQIDTVDISQKGFDTIPIGKTVQVFVNGVTGQKKYQK